MATIRSRGGRQTMTRDGVVAAAVELADDVGLDGLTMRELASRVGLKPVSLYHHVDDKDDLLDGMIDAVFAEIELPTDTTDWKAALRLKALTARRSLARHRWAIGLLESCRNRPRCRYLRPNRVRGAASGVARP